MKSYPEYHIGQPLTTLRRPSYVALAYATFDDRRGALEIEIKEETQGFELSKRQKKRVAAQYMVVLLNTLAHNVLVWARRWLCHHAPKLERYGVLRLVRDVFSVSGKIQLHSQTQKLKRIALNRAAPLAPVHSLFFHAYRHSTAQMNARNSPE